MLQVIKADGTSEDFSEEKLLSSIRRAGVPSRLHSLVLEHIKKRIYDNIPTYEIYRHIEEFLEENNEPYVRTKYSLKSSIMQLGPTGFPFEVYVAQILKAQGFQTEIGTFLVGKCVNHEIDIVAKSKDKKIFVECKFHNRPGIKSQIHVSLYTKARFDDIRQKHNFSKALLVTNTKITSDALSYALCEGIDVISWTYPEDSSLRELIEKYKLYPITQLSYLSLTQKQELLSRDVVLIKQICENPNFLNQINIPKNKIEEIIKEANFVCSL
ncbi:MAG: restriction endonuclease [Candidatus Levybacteria bacterium]|nr:restriction endonuclease [Candidatus Levybacteria bacterium]